VLVGNPDIVAPRDDGYSFEPGHYAHQLAEIDGVAPLFYGKPFGAVFARALARFGVTPERVLMVGDTLHTDILGGNTAGTGTVLVSDTGSLHRGDVTRAIAESGITPDYVIPHI
jgi:ribonucleotide monophosphatase NagD (HAD superfamily)